MKYVNAPVMKKDAMALVTGKPVYTDDLAPKDCLIVKVLRSPHAHALLIELRHQNHIVPVFHLYLPFPLHFIFIHLSYCSLHSQ